MSNKYFVDKIDPYNKIQQKKRRSGTGSSLFNTKSSTEQQTLPLLRGRSDCLVVSIHPERSKVKVLLWKIVLIVAIYHDNLEHH